MSKRLIASSGGAAAAGCTSAAALLCRDAPAAAAWLAVCLSAAAAGCLSAVYCLSVCCRLSAHTARPPATSSRQPLCLAGQPRLQRRVVSSEASPWWETGAPPAQVDSSGPCLPLGITVLWPKLCCWALVQVPVLCQQPRRESSIRCHAGPFPPTGTRLQRCSHKLQEVERKKQSHPKPTLESCIR